VLRRGGGRWLGSSQAESALGNAHRLCLADGSVKGTGICSSQGGGADNLGAGGGRRRLALGISAGDGRGDREVVIRREHVCVLLSCGLSFMWGRGRPVACAYSGDEADFFSLAREVLPRGGPEECREGLGDVRARTHRPGVEEFGGGEGEA